MSEVDDVEAEVKKLKNQRRVYKGQLTRFSKFLEDDNVDLAQLKIRVEKVEPLLAQYDEVQSTIDYLEDKEDETDREGFENSYYALITKAKSLLPKDDVDVASQSRNECVQVAKPNLVKLPTIDLPTFSGEYERFRSFLESFNSLIGHRDDLDNIQKLHYLRSALKGDALEVISSLDTNGQNYSVAWELLQQRYDNPRLVINKHMKAIFETEKIERESSSKLRHMLDTVVKHYKALQSLNVPVSSWDVPLVFVLSQRLDPWTFRAWESNCQKDTYPTFAEFIEFLQTRAHLLESLESEKQNRLSKNQKMQASHTAVGFNRTGGTQRSNEVTNCPLCPNASHKLFNCRKFLTVSIPNRLELVAKTKVCANCLSGIHMAEKCAKRPCPICSEKHNSLLHGATPSSAAHVGINECDRQSDDASGDDQDVIHSVSVVRPAFKLSTVVLSTAMVHIMDKHGKLQPCRVLLDSGSQVNCMTRRMADILGLPREQSRSTVFGIGGNATWGCKKLICKVSSTDSQFHFNMECLILPKITLELPTMNIDISSWNIPAGVRLADPNFHQKSRIDLLIGAGEFFSIIGGDQIPIGPNLPILQLSKFGWIVAGKVGCDLNEISDPEVPDISICHLTLEDAVSRFWEVEEISPARKMNPEEQLCEQQFVETTKRDPSGRFIVKLPIKPNIAELGASHDIALRRFLALEKRLARLPDLKTKYVEFMREYISLGHMVETHEPLSEDLHYYMPHHAVINEARSTTKLRVVFDASCKSSSGLSLNDTLRVGPVIQNDLVSTVLKFRRHQYVFTADITKMYRQINVAPEQHNLQLIYWREDIHEDIKTYCLKTVTYGTGPASYLATRCLQELSQLHGDTHPLGARAVAQDFYVDDLLTGGDNLEETQLLQKEVIDILRDGQFDLHKWCSNNPRLLESIPFDKQEHKYELSSENQAAVKTLGIWWNPAADSFRYSINLSDQPVVTRKGVVSEIARIFDPLGLLGPVNFKAKTIMRQICKEKKDWKDDLTGTLLQEWLEFRQQLTALQQIEIPRRAVLQDCTSIEIHGFSDASEQGYGASIYLRSSTADGQIQVHLLCAKSKLAPAGSVTIPRLELCGAVLLAKLTDKCMKTLNISASSCHLWTDSTVTLAWISKPSENWKTYVANRVTEIHELTKDYTWHHVPGADNPSDQLSRGLKAVDILHSSLWWSGPPWLLSGEESWPSPPAICLDEIPDSRPPVNAVMLSTTSLQPVIDFSRFSRYDQLLNATVYALRFIDHLPNKPCVSGPITAEERERSLKFIVRLVQASSFPKDIHDLTTKGRLSKKSVLRSINPFIDKDGLLRVGGRLQKGKLDYDSKHQLILPSTHRFTTLLAEQLHRKNAHAGPRLLVATLRQRFWPIHALSLVKKIFHQCVVCFRHKPRAMNQLMGELPAERIEPNRPFVNSGVDFCGPVMIKASNLRNSKSIKAYIAVFVCLSTKAVHVELVGDMSTESFINALKRFFARRGKAKIMFSDNGTNFVGAARELKKDLHEVLSSQKIANYAANEGVTWKFIPPKAPHFGGLWESAIKSLKYHLKHIIGDGLFTFEEMTTFLAMIESFLNSRPLLPLSDDPSDLQVLTPGHFLTGDALTSVVETDLTSFNGGLLRRWRRIQKMYQLFWARWSKEYLTTLQERKKWTSPVSNLKVDQLVLVKDENLPPLKWSLARVMDLHPGTDGLNRVATIRTANGVLKRPVNKLCPLPMDENEDTEPRKRDDDQPQFHVLIGYKLF